MCLEPKPIQGKKDFYFLFSNFDLHEVTNTAGQVCELDRFAFELEIMIFLVRVIVRFLFLSFSSSRSSSAKNYEQ